MTRSFLLALFFAQVLLALPSASAFECPAGTVVVGQPPPDGKELYCAKPGTGDLQVRHGAFRQWHSNGSRRVEGNYNLGEKDGTFLTYYDNGQISKRENFARGVRHGKFEMFFDNGVKKVEEHWVRGKREGLRKVWSLDGQPSAKLNLVNNKKVGPAQYWHKTGKIKSSGFFDRSSKKAGVWVQYNSEGQRISEGQFRAGKRDGKWRYWEDDGSLKRIVEFKNGAPIRTKKAKKGEKPGKQAMTTIPETEPGQDSGNEPDVEYGDPGTDPEENAVVDEPVAVVPTQNSKRRSEPSASQPIAERRSYKDLLSKWQEEKGIPAQTDDTETSEPNPAKASEEAPEPAATPVESPEDPM